MTGDRRQLPFLLTYDPALDDPISPVVPVHRFEVSMSSRFARWARIHLRRGQR